MKNRKHFLIVQNETRADFIRLRDDEGIKVFLPSYISSERFKKISTEPELVYGETSELCAKILKNKYKDYDVFYLNISSIEDSANYKQTVFDLSLQPDITVALVCIPRNNPGYKQNPKVYCKFYINFCLEKYYNDYKDWVVYVVDENFSENYLDKCSFFRCALRYEQSEKEFFEKCKNKYGIPELEIKVAKHIMNKKITGKRITYKITPAVMKEIRMKITKPKELSK